MRRLLLAAAVLLAADAQAQTRQRPAAVDTPLVAAPRDARSVAWAAALQPVRVASAATTTNVSIRLYTHDGEVDESARASFEEIVAGDAQPHPLAPRLVQLVFKAAYHFANARVVVVSGWRDRAGRHTTGEALDFKLEGVHAAQLAAWLRGLSRVGVGVYTHPCTQSVHLDLRDTIYHWIDGSPPGVTWRERQLRDPGQVKRDALWSPEADLP